MKVNEIFYSLQGEGYFTGTPAVFVRLSGCNMACDFCDTDHRDGADMSDDEIVVEVMRFASRHVVVTGGEPTLQLTESLVTLLHSVGCYVQIETNGSVELNSELEQAIDWITCSPKYGAVPKIVRIDELKVVYDMNRTADVAALDGVVAKYYCLQPCDRGDAVFNSRNLRSCIEYVMAHPKWSLSLQTHKLLDIR